MKIDLPADLNFEDDDVHNLARLAGASDPDRVVPGVVLVAGRSDGWSWAEVLDVENGWVTFRQILHPMAELIGECYEEAPAGSENDRLLELTTADGRTVYPVWQFTGDLVRDDIAEVLRAFGDAQPWPVAVWLCTPNVDLDGRNPIQALDAGGNRDLVVRLAGQTAWRWRA